MKKNFIFILLITSATPSIAAPPLLHDFFDMDEQPARLPQFIVDWYDSLKDAAKNFRDTLVNIPSLFSSLKQSDPHDQQLAYVRYTTEDDLCSQEKKFIDNRLNLVKENLSQEFNIELDDQRIPRIAYCFSGGGFRAMLMTFGFLQAAEQNGILDYALYVAGLSGSTWAIAPWIASGKKVDSYFEPIVNRLQGGMDQINETQELSQLIKLFINKMYFKQIVSVIDIYGSILANTLLKSACPEPLRVTLSNSHQHVSSGELPMPIYTAIHANNQPYEWLEFTPFEAGSSHLQSYIPIWSLGRKFKHGFSTNQPPEQTLGYFMGIFGSAFSVTIKDLIRLTADNIAQVKTDLPSIVYQPLKNVVLLVVDSMIGNVRFFPAHISNFCYLHPKSPLSTEKTLALVDAGIDFNLPLPPLLRSTRKLDIIIIYDASANVAGAPELQLAQKYAQRKGIKFPPISLDGIHERPFSIFKDDTDPETPIIVYFPRIKISSYNDQFNPDECITNGYCNTYNFAYTPDQIKQVAGLAGYVASEYQEIIKNVVKDVLVGKYGYVITATYY